jgi:thioredoxin-like negative regulator of GroEL
MEPSLSMSQAILGELSTIRWLLTAILAVSSLVALVFGLAAFTMISVVKENIRDRRNDLTRSDLDDLLAAGKASDAKRLAQQWLAREPRRADAFWALARAHHQLGELTDSKRILQDLLTVAPDESYRVSSWLERIEADFNDKKPRAVE